MEDALIMGCRQRSADLLYQISGAFERDSFRLDQRAQRYAVDELHDEIGFAVGEFAVIEDADHSGMIDPRQRFLLLLELLHHPGVLQRLLEQDFDYHRLVMQLSIMRQIHCADAALSQFLLNKIAAIESDADQPRRRRQRSFIERRRAFAWIDSDRRC